jgi:hypothetical protein
VHFLVTLRGGHLPSAIDASRRLAGSGSQPPQPSPRILSQPAK